MIRGKLWELVDDDSLRKIEKAALSLLTRRGAEVRHEEILGRLESAGCKVERSTGHVHFAENLIQDTLAKFGSEPTAAVEVPAGWTPARGLRTEGSFPHFLDWPACKRRLATVEDVTAVTKMAHALDEFEVVGKALTCSEIDQRIEPVWAVATMMGITDKPIGSGEVFYAENIKHLVRLGEIYSGKSGDTQFVAGCDFCVSPLRYGRRMLECMIEKSSHGITHAPGSMTISGLSGPVTVAGTAALALAELIGGWVIYYLLDPELPVGGIIATGSLDMRTTRASFGSPEAILQDLTVVQAARRLWGIGVGAAYGYVDCKTPGIEAVFEKMLPLLAFPFEGYLPIPADGLLSAGQDYSPVQHLLSLDMREAMRRVLGTFEVSEETLALDVFDEIPVGSGETFLDKSHTLEHYKTEQWYPRWLDHRIWQGEPVEREAEREMLERIDDYWKDAVRRYQRPEIDEKRLKEAQKVLRAAEQEIPLLEPKA